MKDIVIIANFCRDLSKEDNGRFLYLCKLLCKENSVELITSDFSHITKKRRDKVILDWPFKVTFLNEPGYRRNISLKRFVSHNSWGKEVKRYLSKRERPDVIYCAVPSLTAPLSAARYCSKNGIRFVIDIQDLWPEAFLLAFNVPLLSNLFFAPFKHYVNGIYKLADEVCGVSKTYVKRGLSVNTRGAEGHVVFLGTELAVFDRNAADNPVEKPEGELWLGYCGTLGASYDIGVVIDALALLKERGVKPPKFIVLGDGERRSEFEQRASSANVDCLFTGRLPYDQMCGWLNSCDIAANPISHNAAQSIINKHGDYASAGLPVISTQENQEYRDLVDEYSMGYNCNNSDAEDFSRKLEMLIKDDSLRHEMGQNARRCAEERFDRAHTYKALVNTII